MERCVDGNTGNTQFVFVKNGVIGTSLPLDIEYTHDNCAFELGFVAAQLLEMAQRYYDEVKALTKKGGRERKKGVVNEKRGSCVLYYTASGGRVNHLIEHLR